MSGSSSVMLGIAGGVSWGLTLLLLLVFMGVVATVVRSRRPDAAAILLLALGLELLVTVGAFAAQLVVPRLVGFGGADGMTTYAQAQAMTTIIAALGHSAARVLIIWGVVRLSSDKPMSVG